MEKKNMLQVLVPAAAAAAVVLLIGALIAMSDWNTPADKSKPSSNGPTKGASVDKANMNEAGMVNTIPDINSPDWKPETNGMKTWDVVEGTGEPCPPGATVTIHYTGWTTDGKSFDSSLKNGRPATFPLANLVKGWQIGIPGMKPGGVRRLSIPSDLGYGAHGQPPSIPGGATLIFEIKMLGFS